VKDAIRRSRTGKQEREGVTGKATSSEAPNSEVQGGKRGSAARPAPRKALSQHFLKSKVFRERIVEAVSATADDVVVEIGAGTGALTRGLARRAGRVIAVEVDRRLAAFLRDSIETLPSVTVLCEDILNVDLARMAAEHGRERLLVVGNLPYHVTTEILMHLVRHCEVISRAVVMVQREYAERLLAGPGGRDYGAVTVRIAYSARASKVCDVPASAFSPKPKVDSTVISLEFAGGPPVRVSDEGYFFALVRGAFAQRRKMLVNSLSSLWKLDKEEVKAVCRSVGIDPGRRPETLSLEEFARLADAFGSRG